LKAIPACKMRNLQLETTWPLERSNHWLNHWFNHDLTIRKGWKNGVAWGLRGLWMGLNGNIIGQSNMTRREIPELNG
jgi:hypothetical protein